MTKKRPWMKYITKDDMPNDDLLTFSDYVGIEETVDIVLALPGLIIPIPRKPFRIAKERYIIDNFNGTKYSINQLALDCDMSVKQVYKILRKHLSKQKKDNS
ncbi:MAG: hypothetical protein IKN65_08510 [Clostridia bacterium]|nr:hypothetical protein [Clostridia bacterium]